MTNESIPLPENSYEGESEALKTKFIEVITALLLSQIDSTTAANKLNELKELAITIGQKYPDKVNEKNPIAHIASVLNWMNNEAMGMEKELRNETHSSFR